MRKVSEGLLTGALLVGLVASLQAQPRWPAILAGPALSWELGVAIEPFVFPALEAGGEQVSYTIRNRNMDRTDGTFPPGISFDPESLTLSGVPERPTSGLSERSPTIIAAGDIFLTATDGEGSDEIRIHWVLREAEPYYEEIRSEDQIWEVGEPVYLEIPEVDRGTAVFYRNGLDSRFPKGVFFDAATMTIQGTPKRPESGIANIWAQNQRSIAYRQTYWRVVERGAPAWINREGEPQRWIVGKSIEPLAVPGVDLNAATYTAEDLPAGLSFDPVSREISGVPSEPTIGTIMVTASNESGSDHYRVPFTAVVVRN